MSVTRTAAQGLLPVWRPGLSFVRTRTRTPNIAKPAIPHWERAVVLKLTKPIYKDTEEGIPLKDKCNKEARAMLKEMKPVNPFEQILANEFREKVENAKLVVLFHKLPITEAEMFAARVQLNKINLEYLKFNKNIMKYCFKGTKYEALLALNISSTCIFVGDNPAVKKLLKLEKKINGLILLGCVVEEKFMSVQDMKAYANLPSLETLQGQLVSILSSPAQHISQNLTANQMELSSALSRYATDTKPDDDPNGVSSS